MRSFIRHAAILAGIGLCAAAAVVFGGLYNVSAALGHLPGVSWILHTTYRNSVQTFAGDKDQPDLTDLGLIQRGAGHYAAWCETCHGAPGTPRNLVVQGMVPAPPHIEEAVDGWNADELHWIVLNGVKMSGMPPWPSQVRAEEVWSVVAFLVRLPELDAQGYRDLLTPDPPPSAASLAAADAELVAACATCHGHDGRGRGTGAAPRLDIQTEAYLEASLLAYARGARASGIMQPIAYDLTPEQVRTVAAYYAAREPEPIPESPPDPALVERGRTLATGGDPAHGIPACAACHGPWPHPQPAVYPKLAGQYRSYLEEQLHLWRSGHRGGTPYAHLMQTVAEQLEEADIPALAAYFASLPPANVRMAGHGS